MNIVKRLLSRDRIGGQFCDMDWQHKLVLAFGMALATGIAAQLRFPLPWSPVPITLQTFVIIFSGVVLGSTWGAVSQVIYGLMGVLGLPVFTGMGSGLVHLLGPTGGFLVGFVLTAFAVGYIIENHQGTWKFFELHLKLTAVSMGIIYGLGAVWLWIWLWFAKGMVPSIYNVLMMGVIPFIPGDLIKVLLVVFVVRMIWPKRVL